ncbi:MAG: hypothetical protein GY754_26510 [bacterium]|nr:hypothetical protein [bacterium]
MKNDSDLREYQICYLPEYVNRILSDLSSIMNIPINYKRIEEASDNKGEFEKKCVCIFRNNNDNRSFIILECRNTGLLHGIVIRCTLDIHETARDALLKWDTKMRQEHHQETRDQLYDVYMNKDSSLNLILEDYHFKDLDEIA